MAPLNLTPLRVSVLRFLAGRPNGFLAKGLVHDLVPRRGRSGWTEQGAARMAGKLLKPMTAAGLIRSHDHIAMYERMAHITAEGRAALARHDEAQSRADLNAAITSGD